MTKSTIQNPHDKLFRAAMHHPEVAHDFLTTHLPANLIAKIDFKSLEICPNTFIDEDLKLTASDVLIKCIIEKKEGYIYILAEHQSTQAQLMPFRLFKYMIKIWDYHQTHTDKKNSLPFPAIFPLVFYTGRNLYKAPKAMWELCGDQSELMKQILSEPFHLIDINTIPENALTSRMWSGTMEFLMRHRFRQHIGQEIEKIAQNINRLMLEEKGQFVLQLLSYIMAVDEEHRSISELTTIIHDKLSPNVEKEIMSLAEKLMEEGELKKSFEIAKKMLADGVDPVFVAKYTEIPLEKVKKLQTKN
ncbi:MAG: Rpn family recombination-promoting nuclease/putative transposase [Legionella sp.]|nr:Rpn family recombination-promoting nuclease/putative transposase [Legionella sp.]